MSELALSMSQHAFLCAVPGVNFEGRSLPEMRVQYFQTGEWCLQSLLASTHTVLGSFWCDVLCPSEYNVNLLYKTAARVQGLWYDLVWLRYRCWPYRLVELLDADLGKRDVAISELLTCRTCMLDEYTHELRRRYPDGAALASEACQTEIRLIMELLDCTTYDCERLHSRNVRRLQKRHQQTNPMTLAELAVEHVGFAAPRKVAALRPGAMKKSHGCHSSERCASLKKGRGKQNKLRKAGGGSWRAYVHSQAQAKIGEKLELKSLAEQYRGLSAEEKAPFQAIGRIASWRHRQGQVAFPMTHHVASKQPVAAAHAVYCPALRGPDGHAAGADPQQLLTGGSNDIM